jgi:1,4-dihydroxy-6-naphthoate synthase
VADKYVLMASGSSIGDGYGPMIIANRPMEPDELKGKRIAIPGTLTTAYLAAKLYQPDFEAVVTPFDKITDAIKEHSVDAGEIVPLAAQKLLDMGYDAGLISKRVELEFIR